MTKLKLGIACLYAVVKTTTAVSLVGKSSSSTAGNGVLGLGRGPNMHSHFKEPVPVETAHRTEGLAAARNIAAALRCAPALDCVTVITSVDLDRSSAP